MLSFARRLLHVVCCTSSMACCPLHAACCMLEAEGREKASALAAAGAADTENWDRRPSPVESVNVCMHAGTGHWFRCYVCRCVLHVACYVACYVARWSFHVAHPTCSRRSLSPKFAFISALCSSAFSARSSRAFASASSCTGAQTALRRETKTQRQTTCGGRPACSRNQTCTTTQHAERTADDMHPCEVQAMTCDLQHCPVRCTALRCAALHGAPRAAFLGW